MTEIIQQIALLKIKGLGPYNCRKLISDFNGLQQLFEGRLRLFSAKYEKRGLEIYRKIQLAKKELINTCNYRYNKQQDCISKTCTSSNTQSTEIYSYQEGKKHTCTEIVQGDTVRKVLYSYNKLGKLHKIYEQYQTADVKTSTHYLYDKKGNNSERLIYDQSGQLNLKYLYQYDSLGRNIKQSIMTSDGILGYAVSLGYNEQGNIATRSNFSGPKTSPQRVDYTYEYDKQKNWLVQNTQSAAGILQKKTKREIVYY